MRGKQMKLNFKVDGNNFLLAGEASGQVKKALRLLGIPADTIRRIAISMYEAEINMVIHAGGGEINVEITPEKVSVILEDQGPGISDIELAMQEGYTTASNEVRELGFGAGMGLPNIKRYSDNLTVKSEVGKGTTVEIVILL